MMGCLPQPELIRSNGYPCEEHWVHTADEYILALHRIPHGKDQDPTVQRWAASNHSAHPTDIAIVSDLLYLCSMACSAPQLTG